MVRSYAAYMMIDNELKDQLRLLLSDLQAEYIFEIEVHPEHLQRGALLELMGELCPLSDKLSWRHKEGEDLEIRLMKDGRDVGVKFRALPGEYEFASLILLLLNADQKGKNMPEAGLVERIKALVPPLRLKTFILLTCPNCPSVVQALNIVTLNHEGATHEILDTSMHEEEAERMDVQAVPAVFLNGELLHIGRTGLEVLVDKLEVGT